MHAWSTRTCWRLCLILGLSGLIGFGSSPALANADQMIKNTWVNSVDQLTAAVTNTQINMSGAMGSMMDGQNTANAQATLQALTARAVKDYTPGENICRIGTLTRSLAQSDQKVMANKIALSTLMLDRSLNTQSRNQPDEKSEEISRLELLRSIYCNPGDNDKTAPACNCDLATNTCSSNGPQAARMNRDLDFARLFASRLALNVDFTNASLSADEQDVMSFINNLVAFKPVRALPSNERSKQNPLGLAEYQIAMRRVQAVRSVVRDVVTTQIAQKSSGADGVTQFLENVLREMGMSSLEAQRVIRDQGPAPSYQAQMEILTKVLYQNPNFYANLVDKPGNVDRLRAAMLAVKLMQQRDVYESVLRREMVLSQLLEAEIRTESERMQARVSRAQENNSDF